jgi:hypothetical protein
MAVKTSNPQWNTQGAKPGGGAPVQDMYPWDEWLNGDAWELEQGVDFHNSMTEFQNQAHGVARQWNLKIRTSRERRGGSKFWIQAHG